MSEPFTTERLRDMMAGASENTRSLSTVLWAADRIDTLEADLVAAYARIAALETALARCSDLVSWHAKQTTITDVERQIRDIADEVAAGLPVTGENPETVELKPGPYKTAPAPTGSPRPTA